MCFVIFELLFVRYLNLFGVEIWTSFSIWGCKFHIFYDFLRQNARQSTFGVEILKYSNAIFSETVQHRKQNQKAIYLLEQHLFNQNVILFAFDISANKKDVQKFFPTTNKWLSFRTAFLKKHILWTSCERSKIANRQ